MKISGRAHLANANHGLEAAAEIIIEEFVVAAIRADIELDEETNTLTFEWDDDE